MLGHNFYMLVCHQATESPTMSYIVHRTKPQTSHETKFYNIQTKLKHLRTGTKSLAMDPPLKTASDCFYIAMAEELKLVFSTTKL